MTLYVSLSAGFHTAIISDPSPEVPPEAPTLKKIKFLIKIQLETRAKGNCKMHKKLFSFIYTSCVGDSLSACNIALATALQDLARQGGHDADSTNTPP